MAPPAAQRSTTNRKAQLGVFAGYVTAGAGAVLGAALLIISLWRPESFNGLRAMAADIASPVGQAGAASRVETQGFFEAIAGYYDAGSRNAQLQREMEIARVRLAEAAALAQENERLKAVLGLVEGDPRPVAVGRLIGSTSASSRRLAYLDAGRRDGVHVGMPVSSPMGLVGRVLEAGRTSSRVLLLTDSESIVPVRRATDNVVAFAEGRADGSLRLRLVNLGVNPLKVGDVFVTSGAGGMFRPGIAVAKVTRLTDDGGIGQLLSNPAATDVVVVEPIWQRPAVQAVARIEQPLAETEEPQNGTQAQQDDTETPPPAAPPTPTPSASPAPAEPAAVATQAG